VFSKKASNQLLLYCTYDYKIQLKNADSLNDIGYSLLYYYLAVKLEKVKRYITENLDCWYHKGVHLGAGKRLLH
jgi:hypothetical protein